MTNDVDVRVNPPVTAGQVCTLRASVGWDGLEADYPGAFSGYWATVGAFDPGGRLVGWCAILSDGVRHAVLLDVIVHPERQRCGLGRRLVARAIEHVRASGITLIHADFAPELAPFYERCGFRIGMGGIYEVISRPTERRRPRRSARGAPDRPPGSPRS